MHMCVTVSKYSCCVVICVCDYVYYCTHVVRRNVCKCIYLYMYIHTYMYAIICLYVFMNLLMTCVYIIVYAYVCYCI